MERHDGNNIRQVAMSILAYLVRHPAAKDGIEGIVEWWVLEQRIVDQTAVVGAALEKLVEAGWLVAEKKPGRGRIYGINPHRVGEISELVGRSAPWAGNGLLIL